MRLQVLALSSDSLFECCLDHLAVPTLDQVDDLEDSQDHKQNRSNETEHLQPMGEDREHYPAVFPTILWWLYMDSLNLGAKK